MDNSVYHLDPYSYYPLCFSNGRWTHMAHTSNGVISLGDTQYSLARPLIRTLVYAGIFQFIVYGFLIDKARGTRSQNIVIASILLSHIILAILIFVLRNLEWRWFEMHSNSL